MKLWDKLKNLSGNLFGYPHLHVKYLRKDCLNVIDIPTGMMPMQKAQEYLKKVMDSFNTEKSDDYRVIYLGRNNHMPESSVKYLKPGVLNVLEIDIGMLKDDRAESYIKRMNDMVREIEGYNVIVVPKIRRCEFDRNVT